MKIGKALDFLKTQALNFCFQNLGGAPSTPATGQAWFNTATGRFEIMGNAAPYDPTDRTTHSGTQAASTIDATFDTRVRTSRLDQMAAPTGPVSLNNQKATSMAAPTVAGDGVNYGTLQAWRLDQLVAPTADVAMGGRKLTGGAAGVATTDFVIKSQLDNMQASIDQAIAGLDIKTSVRVAATGNTPLTGVTQLDGYTLTGSAQRVLLPAQTDPVQNGIYTWTAGTLTRAADATTGNLSAGAIVMVENNGTTNKNTSWRLDTADPITVGTTPLTWTKFAANFTPVQGPGIQVSGSTISADVVSVHGRIGSVVGAVNDYDVDQIKNTHASAHGFWTATGVLSTVLSSISNLLNQRALASRAINTPGGSYLTGGGNLLADRSLAVDAVTTGGTAGQAAKIPATGAGGKLDVSFLSAVLNGTDVVNSVATGTLGTTIASALTYLNNNLGLGSAKSYSETLATGATSYVVTHNLGKQDLVGSVREVATNDVLIADIQYTTANTATVSFTVAQAAGANRVTFVG